MSLHICLLRGISGNYVNIYDESNNGFAILFITHDNFIMSTYT